MSDTYTKLFSSITESTVWGESYSTRIVWVTMLAMADARGNVYGAVPGLARRANVTLEETEKALAAFLAPDPYSRTRDEDGRRIECIDGGWRLINHAKYGAVRGTEERREYKREWDRQNRPSGHGRAKQSDNSPTQSDESPTKSDSPAPPTPTPTPERARAKATVRQAAHTDGFDDFWQAYPVKKGKQAALKAWARLKLAPDAVDAVLFKLRQQVERDHDWLRGFAPHPATYLNGARWNDEIADPRARAGPAETRPMGKQAQGLMALEALKSGNRVAAGRVGDGVPEALLLGPGTHPGG